MDYNVDFLKSAPLTTIMQTILNLLKMFAGDEESDRRKEKLENVVKLKNKGFKPTDF